MKRLVISAPFGNYISASGCSSTWGTFTLHNRGGRLWRLWRAVWTLRPVYPFGGWVNALGLPNPGINAFNPRQTHDWWSPDIVSIHGFDAAEWLCLVSKVLDRTCVHNIEFNLSCPNVHTSSTIVNDATFAAERAIDKGLKVIVKVPPIRWFDYVDTMYKVGVRWFHLCNTYKTRSGGLSGKALMPLSLWAVEEVKNKYPDTMLIGGGGVTCEEDVVMYRKAGASSVAVASVFLKLRNYIYREALLSKLMVAAGGNEDV